MLKIKEIEAKTSPKKKQKVVLLPLREILL